MAIESIVSEVDLDIYDHDRITPVIKAISGDSSVRYVRGNLFLSGTNFFVNDNEITVTLCALRPDRALVIGFAEYTVDSVLVSPEYIPVSEEIELDPYTQWYYIDGNDERVDVDDPSEIPEGFEPMSEEISGETYTQWYYIDTSGNRIDVESGDTIPAVYETYYDLYGEITKEMTEFPGITRMQFKIVSGSQELRTSIFNVNVGENLENKGNCIIDLTAE